MVYVRLVNVPLMQGFHKQVVCCFISELCHEETDLNRSIALSQGRLFKGVLHMPDPQMAEVIIIKKMK